MSAKEKTRDKRGIVLVLLILLVFALLIAGREFERPPQAEEQSDSVRPNIEMAAEKLLTRYHVEVKASSPRKARNSTSYRTERRVSVPTEFNALNFNHDLNQAVAGFGATVIASENSQNKTVTMHIKKDGVIVHSVVFVPERP
jgi:hypothetical protein